MIVRIIRPPSRHWTSPSEVDYPLQEPTSREGCDVLPLRSIQFTWPTPRPRQFPWTVPAFVGLESLDLHSPVTFLVGDNGSGKSTLLESLAEAAGFNPEGGSQHANYAALHTNTALHGAIRLIWNRKTRNGFFFRAESFFSYAGYVDDLGPGATDPYGGKSLHEWSHGESFLALFKNRLRGQGRRGPESALYLFDEPEAALSTTGQLAFLRLLKEWADSRRIQVIAATHSPILLALPGASLYSLDSSPLQPITYRESAPYQLTRAFLESPDRFLREIFQDDEPPL